MKQTIQVVPYANKMKYLQTTQSSASPTPQPLTCESPQAIPCACWTWAPRRPRPHPRASINHTSGTDPRCHSEDRMPQELWCQRWRSPWTAWRLRRVLAGSLAPGGPNPFYRACPFWSCRRYPCRGQGRRPSFLRSNERPRRWRGRDEGPNGCLFSVKIIIVLQKKRSKLKKKTKILQQHFLNTYLMSNKSHWDRY